MSNQKFKRGDINSLGLIFFCYSNKKEKWVTEEKFLELKQKELISSRKPERMERKRQKSKQRYYANKEGEKARKAQYYKKNKQKILAKTREYDSINRKKVSKRKAKYQRERRQKNFKYKTITRLRTRIRSFLMRNLKKSKNFSTWEALGCDWECLKKRFESFFNEKINWSNVDEWHIDHIIPLSSAKNEEGFKLLCHYTNLRPMLAEDNLKKGNKYEPIK